MLYRAFFLDEDDRIFAFHLMECLDDCDAIAQAQDLPAKCSTIEVWEGARVVGRTTRPRRIEVTADSRKTSASSTIGEVGDKPPHLLISLAMLELQANHRERAECLVDEVYAAFDQADLIIRIGVVERTDGCNNPAGCSDVLPRSSPHHAMDRR